MKNESIDTTVEDFALKLNNAIIATCQTSVLLNTKKLQGWNESGLAIKRKQLVKLKKKFLSKPTKVNEENYKLMKREYNKSLRNLKKSYYYEQFNLAKQDTRKTWQLLNDALDREKGREKENVTFNINQKKVTNVASIANHFKTLFSQIPDIVHSDIEIKPHSNLYSTLNFQSTTCSDILKIVQGMKPKKSSGSDILTNKLLKSIIFEILVPLKHIFNHCIKYSYFPSAWKVAKVIPLYKGKGAKSECQNYRPISLLPVLSKVLEKTIYKRQWQNNCHRNNLQRQENRTD